MIKKIILAAGLICSMGVTVYALVLSSVPPVIVTMPNDTSIVRICSGEPLIVADISCGELRDKSVLKIGFYSVTTVDGTDIESCDRIGKICCNNVCGPIQAY